MLACLALVVFVSFPPPLSPSLTQHEWHSYTFCEPGHYLGDSEARLNPEMMPSSCEWAANVYIRGLQQAGILPGSMDVIQFRVTCTNEV